MKKSMIGLSLVLNVILVGIIGYHTYFLKDQGKKKSVLSEEKGPVKTYRIAILTPTTHPSLQEIEQGFKEALSKKQDMACDFTVYNGNGDRTLMRSQVEEIIQQQYDLMFTIGAFVTQLAKEITTKKQSLIPIVFGAVADPVRLNLISSEISSGNHLTGSSASTDYPDQIKLLLMLKKNINKVLIVYDPTQSSGLEKDKNEVVTIFENNGVKTEVVEVYKTNEIFQKVPSLLDGVDVVMVFKDNTVIAGIDSLIKLCNQRGITLFTTDLDSVAKGAVLGFGVHEYSFGQISANNAYIILTENKMPSDVPTKLADNYRLRINRATMRAQGLSLDPEMLLLLQFVEVI